MLKVILGLIGTVLVVGLNILGLAAIEWVIVTVLRYMGVL